MQRRTEGIASSSTGRNTCEKVGALHGQAHRVESPATFMKFRSDEKKLPLYHLALFSRHPLAYKYWDEVLKYSSVQQNFEF